MQFGIWYDIILKLSKRQFTDKAICAVSDPRRVKTEEFADVAELADALDSGSSGGDFVKVQVLSSAPKLKLISVGKFQGEFMPICRNKLFCYFPAKINFFFNQEVTK